MSTQTAPDALDLDWRMPPLRETSVLGRRIAYYEKGEGPPLVLVHGFSGSAPFEWGRVFDLLAEHHRVVAPQLVGFLPSEQPDMVYSTDAQLRHLSGFLKALDLTGCTLAGESYGGWLVAAYAARAAEPGGALTLVGRYAISAARSVWSGRGRRRRRRARRPTRRYGARSSSDCRNSTPMTPPTT